LLLSSGNDSTIKLYDLNQGICSGTLAEHKNVVYSVVWHPTISNLFASCSGDQTAKIWDIKTGKSIKTIIAHNSHVMSIDFNKYDNIISTAGSDGTLAVFDLRGTADIPLFSINGHKLSTKRVCFSPYLSNILASVSFDMNVIIWDIKKLAPVNIFKHHKEFVCGVDFSLLDDKKIATCAWDRGLYCFNWNEPLIL